MSLKSKETVETEKSNINGKAIFYLSLFLGWLGVDRFYAKKTGSGIAKLLTLGGFGIWWIIDLILILCSQFKDSSGKIIKMQGSKVIPACFVSLPCLFCLLCLLCLSLLAGNGEKAGKQVEQEKMPLKETQKGSSFTDSRDGKEYKTVKIGTQTWMAENLNYNAKGSKCYENKESNCQKYGRMYNWATAMGIDEKYNKVYWEKGSKTQGVCPSGWHIPSSMEWETLVKFADASYSLKNFDNNVAGRILKSKSGWNDTEHEYCKLTNKEQETYIEKHNWNAPEFCNGTDNYGFSILPAWTGTIMGGSSKLDDANKEPRFSYGGSYWSSTEKLELLCYEPTQAIIWGVSTNGNYMYTLCLGKIDLHLIRCIQDN